MGHEGTFLREEKDKASAPMKIHSLERSTSLFLPVDKQPQDINLLSSKDSSSTFEQKNVLKFNTYTIVFIYVH